MNPPVTMPMRLDGVTDLPPGKIASVVTFLERFGPPPESPALPTELSIHTPRPVPVATYRGLYRRIGQDFMWMSRALMPDRELSDWLGQPTTLVRVLSRGEVPVGLAELDRSLPGETEIVSFGVVPGEIGTGAAHLLMRSVIAAEWTAGATRLWLHTCTLDHPAAIPFYRRHGFRGYKLAVEICDDPRLSGHLPEDVVPNVPLLRPPGT